MIVSHCPRCEEPFRVPAGPCPDDAYAQCPWCRETFPIGDVLEKLPPVLQVLSVDGQPLSVDATLAPVAAGAGFAHGVVDQPLAIDQGPASDVGMDYSADEPTAQDFLQSPSEVNEMVTDEAGPAVSDGWGVDVEQEDETFVEVDQDEAESWSTDEAPDFALSEPAGDAVIAPMKVSPAPTRPRKKSSSIRKLISIGVGPILALPLAGIILLALGKAPDLGFWPFDGSYDSRGGNTRTFASQPKQVPLGSPRNTTGRSLATDLTPDSDQADPVADALSQISGTPTPDEELQDSNDDSATGSRTDIGDAGESITMPTGDEAIQITPIPPDSKPVVESPLREDVGPGLEMPSVGDETDKTVETNKPVVTPPGDDPAAARSSVEMASATETNATDPAVVNASTKASEMLDQLIDFQGVEDDRRKFVGRTYAAISAVGAVAGDGDPNAQQLVDRIVQTSLLEDFSTVASTWLQYDKRPAEGALLIGSLSTGEKGATITLPKGTEVSVTGSIELPDAARVLVLGRIIQSASGQAVELVVAEPLQ